MLKKVLFLAAVSGAIISAGAFTAPASAAIATTDATKIFDLSGLDEAHRALVIDALDEFDYDWSLMKPALKAKTGKTHIPIRIVDIPGKWNAVGLSWQNGVIQIDDQATDPVWFQFVVSHEVGHMVDYFHLQPAKLRGKVAKIYGAPWKEMWHNFNDGFMQVFSTYTAEDATYLLSDTDELALRVLLGGSNTLPTKTEL